MVTLSKTEGVLDVSTYYTLYSKESDQNIMSLDTFMKVHVRMKMWYTHSTKLAILLRACMVGLIYLMCRGFSDTLGATS